MMRGFMSAVERGGVVELGEAVKAAMRRVEDVTAHVAVIGTSRVGKSTFISTALRLSEGEDSAAAASQPPREAPKPVAYSRPGRPCSVFWELPGIEDASFCPSAYLRQVGVEKYAGFFIMSSTEFTKEAVALVSELKGMGKPFYLIHSKIDLRPHCYKNKDFAGDVLRAVRREALPNLDEAYAAKRLFYIDCRDPNQFDFMACVQALQKGAPSALLQHALLLSLNHLAAKIELRNSLKELIPVSAIHSCISHPVPLEGLSYQVNIHFLFDQIRFYRTVLGLDYKDLHKSAKRIAMPTFVLSDEIQTQMARELTEKGVVRELIKWTRQNVAIAPSNLKWVPLLRQLPGGEISGATTVRLLDAMLVQFTDDAYRVESKIAAVLRGD
ncbi:interferon-inducible GTPase 5-like [Pristis pectinata]|uniref:interferon-inducible GTPase 5-like n=1 Tax=Pristis pectinata TaxID=685728 RepID=UPI00223DBD17|nr:interferon-inducible GTPase 5-like [Pristis pectinata]XP_051901312.1 interferon-inducible GTPase 5-like [Pristis pectinata]